MQNSEELMNKGGLASRIFVTSFRGIISFGLFGTCFSESQNNSEHNSGLISSTRSPFMQAKTYRLTIPLIIQGFSGASSTKLSCILDEFVGFISWKSLVFCVKNSLISSVATSFAVRPSWSWSYVSIGDLVKSNLVDLIYPAMQDTCNAVPRKVTQFTSTFDNNSLIIETCDTSAAHIRVVLPHGVTIAAMVCIFSPFRHNDRQIARPDCRLSSE